MNLGGVVKEHHFTQSAMECHMLQCYSSAERIAIESSTVRRSFAAGDESKLGQ